MGKIGKIAPIPKTYGDEVLTIDQQLQKNGYERYPGTMELLMPFKERSGKYRTGLDVTASYLNNLSAEDREAEIARIERDKARIEGELGIPGILDSNSLFYNFAASKEALKRKFGSELQVSPIRLGDKTEFFNLEEVMTEIAWNWARVHPRIAPSLEAWKTKKVSQDVKYYIVDDEVETRQTYNKKKELNKAIAAFEDLTPTKKKQIGRLMGLAITESTTEETVYNLVDTEIKLSEFASGKNKGTSPLRLFNELLKMTDDRLRVKDLIEQAFLHNIYRLGQGGRIMEGTTPIHDSVENLTEYLLDDKNQFDLLALEKRLNGKKIDKL